MKRMKRSTGALGALLILTCGLATGTPTPVAAAPPHQEVLPLHVEDAVAMPGGRLAVVLRAYASRPIGQGQVSFTADPPADQPAPQPPSPAPPSQPLKPAGTLVFSGAGDATFEFEQTSDDPPTFVLRFVSPSATVNVYDGTLAVAFFDLDASVAPGTLFNLRLDPAGTQVLDGDGVPIEVFPLDGKLSVRQAADPYAVAVTGARVARGGIAHLAVQTFEPVPWRAGRIGVRYDPTVLGATPAVRFDPRHGPASFTWSVPTPGLLVLDFASPGDQLNTVPGRILRIDLTVLDTARPNTTSRVWLDPALSWVTGVDGTLLPLALVEDVVQILPPGNGVPVTHPAEAFK